MIAYSDLGVLNLLQGGPYQRCSGHRVQSRTERDNSDWVFIFRISWAACQSPDHTNTKHNLRDFVSVGPAEAWGPFTAPLPPLTPGPSDEWEGELPEGMEDRPSLRRWAGESAWALRVATGATQGLLLGRDNDIGRVGWQRPSQEHSLHINNELPPWPEQEVIHLPHCVDPAGHTLWALRGRGGFGQVPTLCSCPGQVGNHIPALCYLA